MTCPHGEIPAGVAGCVDCMVAVVEAARCLVGWDWFHLLIDDNYKVFDLIEDRDRLRDALRALDGGKIE